MSISKIAEVTVGAGGAASIDFTSIPGTYTDLMIVISGRGNGAYTSNAVYLKPNGATSGGTRRMLTGDGSATYSFSGSDFETGAAPGTSATSNTFSNETIYIPNYAGATNKSWSSGSVVENNATGGNQTIEATLWSSTAAITSLSLTVASASWIQYSTATLYGVLKGSSGGVTVS